MKLTSPVFNYRDFIPAKYTCDGDDVNPLLEISNVPTSVKSLVLIVDDPDAPGGDWVHWTIWNIAPDTKIISENSAPTGAVQGMTDFGSNKYGGPCPPSGIHHYQFKLYALDILLSLNPSAIKKDIEKAMENHILDQTILIGLYKKSKDFKI
ncbi:MAG: YbhB/YbcL family Raf kinase inhibitor-like protein [Xanthomonadaceae bacterium]|nr:YbhB/YbcL family Raf kinase inhibitor-like protein [Rhodospirillaceae bacterium]NIA17603.1 YbhB/YbcL family Raf kinase inhibitor-like protein [Xanthomonadaceae bacterium]